MSSHHTLTVLVAYFVCCKVYGVGFADEAVVDNHRAKFGFGLGTLFRPSICDAFSRHLAIERHNASHRRMACSLNDHIGTKRILRGWPRRH